MNARERTIKRLLGIIALDQTYIEFSLPIVTLVFFDPASRLFDADTSYAVRSMWYGTCLSIPYFINLFFAPFISTLSDEFGRRKFLIFEISSAFFYTLLAGLGILLGHLWLMMLGFVVRGAFSRTNTTALAMIGDTCTNNKKSAYMGYLQVAIAIGACVGPIIAGFFANRFFFSTLNFSLPFFIAAGLALSNAILTYFLIAETLQQKSSQALQHTGKSRLASNLQAVKFVITHPDILKTSLLLLSFQIGWSLYYQFMPPLLKTVYHFDAHLLGIFIGMIAFWLILGAGPIFKWLHNSYNNHQILNISAGIELGGITIALLTYFHYLPAYFLWVSAVPMAVGDVVAYICLTTLYSNVVPDHMQGKVMGINFLIVGLIWGGTSLLGGMIISYSPILPMLIAPLGLVCALFAINANFGRKMVLNYSH
jgi:MFS family permease